MRFARLALAIVDEQHRFGVRQRLRLREKGEAPDLLVMTATPIPRTLALALYGDLDLSVIDELPPGRRPVATRVVGEEGRGAAWELARAELARGRRVYVVCPLLEEGGGEDPAAAVRAAARLRAFFPGTAVGLVHGRMPPAERSRQLERFRSGEAPLLVATTVVEVGLDVPEATVMLVERAERFGLSQLHQLRGRIGRGARRRALPPACRARRRPGGAGAARGARADRRRLRGRRGGPRGARARASSPGRGRPGSRGAPSPPPRATAALLALARGEARALIAADPDLSLPAHAGLRALAGDEERGRPAAGEAG